jgi:hypothetical protein
VPYGCRQVLFTRTSTYLSHVLRIPYVCTRILQRASCKRNTISFNNGYCFILENKGVAKFLILYPSLGIG